MRASLIGVVLAAIAAHAASAQVEIPSGRGPIAVNPVTNRIYVAELDELVEIDAATGAQRRVDVQALRLGSGFGKGSVLGVDPIHNRIYATQPAIDQVAVIDGRTLAVESVAGGGGDWRFASAPALDPARDLAWVVDEDGALARIRGATLAVDRVDFGPYAVTNPVVDPVAGKVFAALPLDEESAVIAVDEDTLAWTTSLVPDVYYPAAIAVDPIADRFWLQLDALGDSPYTRGFDAATFAALGGGALAAGDYAGELGADPVFDRVWSLAGEDGCGEAGAFAGDDLALAPDTRFLGCGSAIANPATGFAYSFWAHGVGGGAPYDFVWKDTTSSAPAIRMPLPGISLPDFGADAAVLAVNVAESRVYVAASRLGEGGFVYAFDEPRRAPVPIATTLWNEPPQPDGSVVVHASATTAWPLPVRGVYWQADAIDGAWSPATPAGAAGTATVTLAPGAHEIHAFAVDGQEATLGEIQRRSPIVGPTTTLPLFVGAPQPHVDVEVDSPWTRRSLPRPGALPVQISLVNATGGPQTFALLLSLRVPGVGDVTLLPATGMQLPNGVGFAAAIHLPVGDFLPTGVYTLGAIVLQAGGAITDQSLLTFTVE